MGAIIPPPPYPFSAASYLLGLLTTAGDLLIRGVSGLARLPIGTTGQFLRVVGGLPAWATVVIQPTGTGTVTTGEDTPDTAALDCTTGNVFSFTVDEATTVSETGMEIGWTVLMIIAVSSSPVEPTWPGTTTKIGTATWSTSATNRVYLTKTGSGTYDRVVAQAT